MYLKIWMFCFQTSVSLLTRFLNPFFQLIGDFLCRLRISFKYDFYQKCDSFYFQWLKHNTYIYMLQLRSYFPEVLLFMINLSVTSHGSHSLLFHILLSLTQSLPFPQCAVHLFLLQTIKIKFRLYKAYVPHFCLSSSLSLF